MPTVVAINRSVYVLGGMTTARAPPKPPPKGQPPINCSSRQDPILAGVTADTCGANVLDNWRLDIDAAAPPQQPAAGGQPKPPAMAWHAVPANPYVTAGAQPNSVVFGQRYIISVSGRKAAPPTIYKYNIIIAARDLLIDCAGFIESLFSFKLYNH